MGVVRGFRELDVYRRAFDAALQIYELSKTFPTVERYSLTDQIRLHRDRFVRISRKRGANGPIRPISPVSFATPMARRQRRKCGSTLLLLTTISIGISSPLLTIYTTSSAPNYAR